MCCDVGMTLSAEDEVTGFLGGEQMRRIIFFCLIVVLLSVCPVRADLVVRDYLGNGQTLVLDTETGYHWYRNLPYFLGMTYEQQQEEIALLDDYGGVMDGWHMATHMEMTTLWENHPEAMGKYMFTPTQEPYYSETRHNQVRTHAARYDGTSIYDECHQATYLYVENYGYDDEMWYKDFLLNDLWDGHTSTSAWVVTQAPLVPIPGAMILAATGLLYSALGLKRLHRKHPD